MEDFLSNVVPIIDRSVKKYLDRKFDYLAVGFGCTGGQHRSVYSAEYIYNYLKSKYDIHVTLSHREQGVNK